MKFEKSILSKCLGNYYVNLTCLVIHWGTHIHVQHLLHTWTPGYNLIQIYTHAKLWGVCVYTYRLPTCKLFANFLHIFCKWLLTLIIFSYEMKILDNYYAKSTNSVIYWVHIYMCNIYFVHAHMWRYEGYAWQIVVQLTVVFSTNEFTKNILIILFYIFSR